MLEGTTPMKNKGTMCEYCEFIGIKVYYKHNFAVLYFVHEYILIITDLNSNFTN